MKSLKIFHKTKLKIFLDSIDTIEDLPMIQIYTSETSFLKPVYRCQLVSVLALLLSFLMILTFAGRLFQKKRSYGE